LLSPDAAANLGYADLGLAVPHIEPGDLLAISCTGAYTYTMSSNYNALPRPAIVLVNDGRAEIIVEREKWGIWSGCTASLITSYSGRSLLEDDLCLI